MYEIYYNAWANYKVKVGTITEIPGTNTIIPKPGNHILAAKCLYAFFRLPNKYTACSSPITRGTPESQELIQILHAFQKWGKCGLKSSVCKAWVHVHYWGGLSKAVQPNFPFRKSDRIRNAAWWTSPLNSWRASFWTNLQFGREKSEFANWVAD